MAQLLSGRPLLFQDGSSRPAEEWLKDKVTLLYFSAHWCGPCRSFTPLLKEFYEELRAAGKPVEIVFVSWDESAEDQKSYFKEMHGQWTRLEHGEYAKTELSEKKYNVDGIPAMKLIKPDGAVVLEDCTDDLRALGPNGANRWCDICHQPVGDCWYKCMQCEDYDLCTRCKTHLQLSAEHPFEKREKPKESLVKKNALKLWDGWMEKYDEAPAVLEEGSS